MVFPAKRLKLLSVFKGKTDKGEYVRITLGDPVSCENISVFPPRDFNVSTLESGSDYDVVLNYNTVRKQLDVESITKSTGKPA